MSLRAIMLILLVVLSIPWVFKQPIRAMAIYLGANVLRPEMFFWGGKDGSFIFMVYAGLIITSVFFRGYLHNARQLRNREVLLMSWLFAAILLSALIAQYPVYRASYYIFDLLKGFIICAFIYLMVTEFDKIKMLQNTLLGCFVFLGIWGIQQQFLGNERLEGLGGSAWGDSNDVAAVFVLFLPVSLAKFFASKNPKERLTAAIISAVMVVLIVCTKSRAGFVGIVVSVAAFGFYSRKMRKAVLFSLVMVVVALPFATQAYLERVKTMKSSETLDPSANSRFILWAAGLMVFSDNPIFGTGFLTYPEAKMKYKGRFSDLDESFINWVFRDKYKKVAHNTYIQMLSDCGLFGALPFILLVFGGISAGFRARRLMKQIPDKYVQTLWLCGLSAGITGYAVCIITLDSAMVLFIYIQLVFTGILSRMITNSTEPLDHSDFRISTGVNHP